MNKLLSYLFLAASTIARATDPSCKGYEKAVTGSSNVYLLGNFHTPEGDACVNLIISQISSHYHSPVDLYMEGFNAEGESIGSRLSCRQSSRISSCTGWDDISALRAQDRITQGLLTELRKLNNIFDQLDMLEDVNNKLVEGFSPERAMSKFLQVIDHLAGDSRVAAKKVGARFKKYYENEEQLNISAILKKMKRYYQGKKKKLYKKTSLNSRHYSKKAMDRAQRKRYESLANAIGEVIASHKDRPSLFVAGYVHAASFFNNNPKPAVTMFMPDWEQIKKHGLVEPPGPSHTEL